MNGARYQRCTECGTDEVRGHFCSWCGGATYTLVDHRHRLTAPGVSECPLGPVLNPSTKPSARAQRQHEAARQAWLASPAAADAEAYITGRRQHRPHTFDRPAPDYEAADRAESEGRREQTCPDCGRTEAAGFYCTFCGRRVHPDEWVARPISEAQRAARTATRAAQGVPGADEAIGVVR